MKILLTSDLHGAEDAFRSFARALQRDYDVGMIAGDLLDDHLSESELVHLPHQPVGDVVNVASRLPEANRTYGTQVVIEEGTHQLAHGQIKDRALGEARLGRRRGVKDPQQLAGGGRKPFDLQISMESVGPVA